jgi:NaMN:DMB phosphoribosyltransferase
VAETQSREQSLLQTGRGTTTINDAVVTSLTSAAVQEVSGAEPEIDTGSP